MTPAARPAALAALGFAAGLAALIAAGLGTRAADTPAGAGLGFRVYAPGVANDEENGAPPPPSGTPTATRTATRTPTSAASPTATATPTTAPPNYVVLQAASGFLFEPPGVVTFDQDVWWSGGNLSATKMARLGSFSSLGEAPLPPESGYSSLPRPPVPGDAFAFELAPREGSPYAAHARLWVPYEQPGAGRLAFLWDYFPGLPCGGATATITALDKIGEEVVRIEGSGSLAGWYIQSTNGGQRYYFPPTFVLQGFVEVKSASVRFDSTATALWWGHQLYWADAENDDAELYNCESTLVQVFDDGV